MARKIKSWVFSHKTAAAIWIATATAVLLLAFIGVARATDRPAFCSSCHEMEPFYDAWSEGPHAGVDCVTCHVGEGSVERLSHKMVALQEVWAHVSGDPTFPLAEVEPIPDERCVACHADIADGRAGFSHAEHAAKGSCTDCHRDAGHKVTDTALRDAGVFDPSTRALQIAARVAAVGQGRADLPGHVVVDCSSCHEMAATKCSSCHSTPAEHTRQGECTTCHVPATAWVFAHPAEGACLDCHTTPAKHVVTEAGCQTCHPERGEAWSFAHPAAGDCADCHAKSSEHVVTRDDCTSCHKQRGKSWAFAHDDSPNCTNCHARPAGHRSGTCVTCHAPSATTWAFSHPGSSASCTSCHSKPAKHRSGSCTSCHSVGKSWGFSHPGSRSTCTSCHDRPSGHSKSSCTSCHSVGKSWSFRHPSSTSCSSCHNPPSAHYGTNCVSCHSPSRSWGNAAFTHPRLKEHSSKSFPCSSCHPSGYSSASCTKCHKNGDPDDDDD